MSFIQFLKGYAGAYCSFWCRPLNGHNSVSATAPGEPVLASFIVCLFLSSYYRHAFVLKSPDVTKIFPYLLYNSAVCVFVGASGQIEKRGRRTCHSMKLVHRYHSFFSQIRTVKVVNVVDL
jgi:hypothetical protein